MSSSDVSSVTNHFSTAAEGFITTTGGSVNAGAATVPLNSTSGLTNGNVFVGIVEPGVANKEQTFTGIVDTSGSQITSVVWTRGTNTAHSAGVTVVDYVTGTAHNMTTKGILVEHSQDGTHGNITPDSVATPTITTDTISEKTPAGGVTIDSLLIKDGTPRALDKSTLSTDSNPYKFSVYRNGSQTVATATPVKIQWNAETFDTNNNFDSTTNFRYVAPIDGFWQINARIENNGSGILLIYLYKNGVEFKQGGRSTIASGLSAVTLNELVQLSATDYIEIFVYSDNAAAPASGTASTAYFSGFLVSKT